MHHLKSIKSVLINVLAIILFFVFVLSSYVTTNAQEKTEGEESISGTVYQFEEKGSYDLSKYHDSYSTESGTETDGQFIITGNISSCTVKNGFPVYSVNGGTLTFSYIYDDDLLKASED